ncbi:N-acetylglucosamine-6-phosphate deacetylase-like [Huso huso]|uniref:N-acetylglucosamine-6-phosphate deacetylase n=1 Tax=Huso huso TaxID=61971 RepID=A0ABR0YU56_HUSHU
MPSNKSVSDAPITQFMNCRILKEQELQSEDLWVREGTILNPEKLFFDEKGYADTQIDCQGSIIAPGFIDVQINGGYGIDFSLATDDVKGGVTLVAKKILAHGVTSFCPTLVTSPPHIYHKVLPGISVQNGGAEGAGVLGVHLEGPFISREKKGAHPEQCLRSFQAGGFQDLLDTYGSLDNVALVTLAPELPRGQEVIRELARRGVTVSLGHSVSDLSQAEEAVQQGATFITHLFNAMLPFHHRDPGIVGLLTSDQLPPGRSVYYGMIADGIHTNPAALRIAHRAHPTGLVLVTDAIPAMGLPPGKHTLGQQVIEIQGLNAYVAGTKTLCGSIATMDMCVRHFLQASGCTVEAALEAASLHPAQLLGVSDRKGTLHYGSDADFVFLDDSLNVRATYIAGEQVWKK